MRALMVKANCMIECKVFCVAHIENMWGIHTIYTSHIIHQRGGLEKEEKSGNEKEKKYEKNISNSFGNVDVC